ncbi:MAG: hypothetical protein Q7R95_04165 [bacterium]|nr:hypothetical protein [bacterium]
MKTIYRENLIKNIILLIVLIFSFFSIHDFINTSSIVSDKSSIGSLLVAVSILGVTACFGNFAFTYEKIKITDMVSRMLAHATTGLLMLLIGMSLEITAVLSSLLIGDFQILNLSLGLLYVASVLYDFWDLKRIDLV